MQSASLKPLNYDLALQNLYFVTIFDALVLKDAILGQQITVWYQLAENQNASPLSISTSSSGCVSSALARSSSKRSTANQLEVSTYRLLGSIAGHSIKAMLAKLRSAESIAKQCLESQQGLSWDTASYIGQ